MCQVRNFWVFYLSFGIEKIVVPLFISLVFFMIYLFILRKFIASSVVSANKRLMLLGTIVSFLFVVLHIAFFASMPFRYDGAARLAVCV
jgi:hypothetical protein